MSDDYEARISALERGLADVQHKLFIGNGQPSLVERVATIEKGMATQTWLLRVILGGVLASIGGQLFTLLRGG